ncbi:hypothetical protein Poly24_15550 [Rosistilla carotiformis]|uniref:Uncharacterized protein n=1 Tax=Rosistilla carotiformis TaxID=2528017 RepID=A0A518JQN1_9BACT|nr:hypothetical protein Poly24_15550 [Rosistilla carotiformis]
MLELCIGRSPFQQWRNSGESTHFMQPTCGPVGGQISFSFDRGDSYRRAMAANRSPNPPNPPNRTSGAARGRIVNFFPPPLKLDRFAVRSVLIAGSPQRFMDEMANPSLSRLRHCFESLENLCDLYWLHYSSYRSASSPLCRFVKPAKKRLSLPRWIGLKWRP